jgi:hypothetical protein
MTARKLRAIQVGCIALVVVCIVNAHFVTNNRKENLIAEAVFSLAAIWGAVGGFTLQRRLLSRNIAVRSRNTKTTPLSRWTAGNLARLWSACSVGVCGLALVEYGGQAIFAELLFTLSLLLLVLWKPGTVPGQATTKR